MTAAAPQKVRLRHIAERAGVSVATVSMALQNHAAINPATRQLVRRVARQLGYRRSKASAVVAAGGKSQPHHFGFISCDRYSDVLERANFEPMVHVLMRDALKIGVRIEMLKTSLDWSQPDVRLSVAQFVEGLDGVLMAGFVQSEMLELLRSLGVPTVVIGYTNIEPEDVEFAHLHRVAYDGMEMGLLATRYLLARGRRRIALMTCASPRGFYFHNWERGYRLAHLEAGVPLLRELVLQYESARSDQGWVDQLLALKIPADALCWPDIEVTPVARALVDASALKIAKEDQVLGGQVHLLERYHIERTPAVVENIAALARAAIERIRVLCQFPSPVGSTTYVPFVVRDLKFPARK